MPTYELNCPECGHRYDRFLMRMIRAEDKVCPQCGSTEVRTGLGGGVVTRPVSSGSSSGACVPRGGFS